MNATWWSRLLGAAPVTVAPAHPTVIRARPQVVVEAPARFAWDEKRWHKRPTPDGLELSGVFRAFDRLRQQRRAFSGRLVQRGPRVTLYIADPPPEIRAHPHGACLQLVEAPWFLLHWQRAPETLDHAILYMERMLDETLNGGRR